MEYLLAYTLTSFEFRLFKSCPHNCALMNFSFKIGINRLTMILPTIEIKTSKTIVNRSKRSIADVNICFCVILETKTKRIT